MSKSFSKSYVNTPLVQCHCHLEQDSDGDMNTESEKLSMVAFHFLFSTSGGLSPTATVMFKWIASRIAEKKEQTYILTVHCSGSVAESASLYSYFTNEVRFDI